MARRSMGMADIKEILVAWDAGEGVSAIEPAPGLHPPDGAQVRPRGRRRSGWPAAAGGARRPSGTGWPQAALARVAAPGKPTPAADEVARHHDYLERWVGRVPLSVLHQRLRDEEGRAAGQLARPCTATPGRTGRSGCARSRG